MILNQVIKICLSAEQTNFIWSCWVSIGWLDLVATFISISLDWITFSYFLTAVLNHHRNYCSCICPWQSYLGVELAPLPINTTRFPLLIHVLPDPLNCCFLMIRSAKCHIWPLHLWKSLLILIFLSMVPLALFQSHSYQNAPKS